MISICLDPALSLTLCATFSGARRDMRGQSISSMRSCPERWARPTTRACSARSRRWSARVRSGASTWAMERLTTKLARTTMNMSGAIRAGRWRKCPVAYWTTRRRGCRRAPGMSSRATSSCSADCVRDAQRLDLDPDSVPTGRVGSAGYHHFLQHVGPWRSWERV